MTNPDNIVRVRARNGGRASVYEANGWAQAFSSGLLEGNGVLQNISADMNVLVGGSASKPDVVLAENPAGYKIALDLVGQQAVAITAPAANSRISAIVAYTDDLSLVSSETSVTGSPASCGLIVVNGSAASSPVAPTDAQIRAAITADGATGSQACYCVIATVTIASNMTIIDDAVISNNIATLNSSKILSGSITFDKMDLSNFSGNYSLEEKNTGYKWVDGKYIYKKTINFGSLPNATTKAVAHNTSNIYNIIDMKAIAYNNTGTSIILPYTNQIGVTYQISWYVDRENITIAAGDDKSGYSNCYVTIFYTKA